MLIIEHYNGETTKISIKHGWERNSWELIVNADDDSSRTVFPIMGNVKSYTVVKRSRQAILDERVRDLAHDVRNRTCKHGSKLAACATCVLDDKDFRDYSPPDRAQIEQTIMRNTARAINYSKLYDRLAADPLSNPVCPHPETCRFCARLVANQICPHVPPGYPACNQCTTCTHGGHPATCVFCAESASNPTVRPPR
jgi:hypothetical protein